MAVLSRRSALGALASAGTATQAIANPVAHRARQDDAPQFLAWEREALFWSKASLTPSSNEDLSIIVDRQGHFEHLITTTPGATLTAARVKAAQAARLFHQFRIEGNDDSNIATLADYALLLSLVATLDRVITQQHGR